MKKTGPKMKQLLRKQIGNIQCECSQLKGHIVLKKRDLMVLLKEHSQLLRGNGWTKSSEANARSTEVCAEMAHVHRNLQQTIERLELLDQECTQYRKLLAA